MFLVEDGLVAEVELELRLGLGLGEKGGCCWRKRVMPVWRARLSKWTFCSRAKNGRAVGEAGFGGMLV